MAGNFVIILEKITSFKTIFFLNREKYKNYLKMFTPLYRLELDKQNFGDFYSIFRNILYFFKIYSWYRILPKKNTHFFRDSISFFLAIDISDRNNNYSDTLDIIRRGWVGEVGGGHVFRFGDPWLQIRNVNLVTFLDYEFAKCVLIGSKYRITSKSQLFL